MASDLATRPDGPAPTDPMVPAPFVVRRRESETSDTVSLTLVPVEPGAVRPFAPGQFNMLYRFGVGEVAVSISGDPRGSDALVHTVRSVGKVSSALAGTRVGEVLGVRGPFGVGWPLAESRGRDIVVIAGGLGLAPLRPVLYELFAHRGSYSRVEVIYGARTPKDLVYYREIQAWRGLSDVRFQTTVDTAGRDWYGDVGVVTRRIPDARFEPGQTVALVCGPEIMMRLSAEALVARGVAESSIWLSLERNMKCAVGICGHCQFGPQFVCRNGPVFRYSEIRPYLAVREL